MRWTEVTVETTAQGMDAVTAMLSDCGITNVVIEDTAEMREFLNNNPHNWDYVDESLYNTEEKPPSVTFYLPAEPSSADTLSAIKSGISRLKSGGFGIDTGSLSLTEDLIDDTVWLNKIKEQYKPFHIADNIVIRPVWEAYTPNTGETVLTLNPGNIFGTGQHQSTQLAANVLLDTVKKGKGQRILDIGCGSGILAILAMLSGAGVAVLTDIDPAAVHCAYENAALNNITADFTVHIGDITRDTALFDKISNENFDIVAANIVADVIISLAPYVRRLIKSNGVFISSGIIDERLDDTRNALVANGYTGLTVNEQEGWCCITCVSS